MPKEITHIILAEKMRDSLPKSQSADLFEYPAPYFFGSTSPDVFYYDIPTPLDGSPSAEFISETIHGRMGNANNGHILWMLSRMRNMEQDRRRAHFAFVAGYLSHIAADTIFHPMVYSRTGNYFHENPEERKLARARHRVLETSLDLYLLAQTGRNLANLRLLEILNLPDEFRDELLAFFSLSLAETYDRGFPMLRAAKRALLKSRIIIGLTLSPFAYRFFSFINRMLSFRHDDLMNLFYPPKPAPIDFLAGQTPHPATGESYPANVEILMKQAVDRGVSYINSASLFLAGEISESDLAREIPPLSLNSGLPFSRVDDMVHYSILPGIERFPQ